MSFIKQSSLILSTALIIGLLTTPTILFAEEINPATSLLDKSITHISFKRITPNYVFAQDNVLNIQVNNSSSFLLLPFKDVRNINKVSFQWRKMGVININDAQQEETRQGDDAYLRVGMILEGKASLPNPLSPKWVKKVRETLHHSSDKMIYLVPGSKHENGQRWKSPYSKDVEIIAVGSKTKKYGWNLSEHTFDETLSVVGLWIMADGDNTQSAFTTKLKTIILN
jgi:hypothetical protein